MLISFDLASSILCYLEPRELYLLYTNSAIFEKAIKEIGKYSIRDGMLFHEKYYGSFDHNDIFITGDYLVSTKGSVLFYGHKMYKLSMQSVFPDLSVSADTEFIECLERRTLKYYIDTEYCYIYFRGTFHKIPVSDPWVKSFKGNMMPFRMMYTGIDNFCSIINVYNQVVCFPLKLSTDKPK